MLIRKTSILSNITREREINVEPEDYARWQLGELIQVAMPYLSMDDREFILTGITQEEWDAAFKEEVED